MRRVPVIVSILVLLALTLAGRTARGQTLKAGCDTSDTGTAGSGILRDHAFSAISYVRTYKVAANGDRQFVRNERYPMRVARNAAGCLRMEMAWNSTEHCKGLSQLEPPPCDLRSVVVFDLAHAAVTHWLRGELAGRGAAAIGITVSQVEEVERATAEMPEVPMEDPPDEPDVRVKILGTKTLEGLRVVGVRATRVTRADATKPPVTTIHEVWASPDMRLVVQVIDGDPEKQLTIAGLEKVSLVADDSLFETEPGDQIMYWPIRASGNQVRIAPDGAEGDVQKIGYWFVRTWEGDEE